jgi:hypothetical protein
VITLFRIILWQQFEIMKMRKQLRSFGREAVARQLWAISNANPLLQLMKGIGAEAASGYAQAIAKSDANGSVGEKK